MILEALNESDTLPSQVQMIDSTISRVYHQVAGAKGGTPKEGFGHSKGGFTTKIHLITNVYGLLPVKAEISPGQWSDYIGYCLLQDKDLPDPKVSIADKVYDANAIRQEIGDKGGIAIIPG